jgi:type I restriction enzyme S subunit
MRPDWPSVELARLIEQDRGISYGIVQPGAPTPDGVPIIRVSDIRNERINTDAPLCVAQGVEAAYSRTRLRGGELLITIVGTIGETAIVPERLAGWNVARAIAVLPIKAEVGASWVKLGLCASEAREMIQSRLNTTVQATLNLGDLAKLPILLPPREERERITSIFGALDGKLDLNRRMNETLEAMARTIFRDWFVDFGPTRAKMEGRAPYLASEIWALFPDRLDEQGKPEGWKSETVLAQANLINGAAYKNMHFVEPTHGLPVVKIAELKNGVTSQTKFTNTDLGDRYKIKDGELLFSWSGNPDTSIDTFIWTGGLAWLNQHIFAVRENGRRKMAYVHAMLKWLNPVFAELARNKQTTGLGHVTKEDLGRLQVVVPSPPIELEFDRIVAPVLHRLSAALFENRALAATRAALLPKLMSGEVRVKDASKVAEPVL